MYATEVIRDILRTEECDINRTALAFCVGIIPAIKAASKYYAGDGQVMVDLIKPTDILFMDKNLKLPDKGIWVGWNIDGEYFNKVGTLVVEVINNVWLCAIFYYSKHYCSWALPWSYYLILPGGFNEELYKKYNEIRERFKWMPLHEAPPDKKTTCCAIGYNLMYETLENKPCEVDTYVLHTLQMFIKLCMCKNVNIETVWVSRLLKKLRKNKVPLFDYKTLSFEGQPIKLQEGQFRTYTEDKPLFGKHAGTYWWQPKLRQSYDTIQ